MSIFKKFLVENSIEINAPAERIWNFLYHIEEHYLDWHPQDHAYFRWTKGKPLEVGSRLEAEETIEGEIMEIKGTCIESIPNHKITLKPDWPLSFMCPRLEWMIEDSGGKVVFRAQTYFRFGRLYLAFKFNKVKQMLSKTEKHMIEEGQNMKAFVEREELGVGSKK